MTISAPLHAATSIKAKSRWTQETESSFKILKDSMSSPPVLTFPEFGKASVVETDASSFAVGAMLAQKNEDGKFHPIQFSSRMMNTVEQKYSACQREA